MNRTASIIRGAVASLFLLASALKVLNMGEFRSSIAKLSTFPEFWRISSAYMIVGAEFLAAALLAFSSTVRWGAWLGALLFSSFTAVSGFALAKGATFDCGCFPGTGWGRAGFSLFILDLTGLCASIFLIVHFGRGKDRSGDVGRRV